MPEPRLLITGAGGQLGRAIAAACGQAFTVHALSHAALDITDEAAVCAAIGAIRPAAVINCAALTDTALCEREPQRAMAINAGGAGIVAAACRDAGSYLMHISTNEVFDGQAHEPYPETAPPAPINAYARAKLAGEQRVLRAHPAALVVRTAWLYGDGTRNFVQRVLQWAAGGQALRVVTDEVATPTACVSLAATLNRLLPERQTGILHATDAGAASRYDWARAIVRLAGGDPGRVRPALLEAFPQAAPKPHYTVLSTARLRALGVDMPDWRDTFAAFMATRRHTLIGA